ncbi:MULTISPECIES: FprA family A-type flavoprotein [Anaerotruncus]|jgi:flavorubredoxin|uniref:FprA family A-type flavoprotein n=1 Tax=Anaerotruncus TaxID=244127 RepID=UPI000E51E9D9|nr:MULTISPECIES: FprA family A-type flavoprotein [Anaerotruncus]RGX56478.1 FprA family A-type flavoprotein [Anaerotruncus sp. AF02-27]
MAAIKITDSIYSVGILNPNMRVFDIVMTTEYGTSYNSYILKGSEKTVLIESCHKTYFKHYLDNIRQVVDPAEIDYIILNHNEPDHSGCLAQLLDFTPNATLIASQAGSIYLKNITNRADLKLQVAKNGEVLDIGGKTLRFISAPFLHWPDSMFTWCEEEKTLFSCDFLGAHYCEPYTFDYNMAYPKKYQAAFRGYYDAIFGPFKPYVLAGLDKIKDLPVEYCCNSHGPVLTRDGCLQAAMDLYRAWSQPVKNERLTIPVFYTSAYGNTRLVAKAIQSGILSVKPDADVVTYDIIKHDMGELSAILNGSDAFALGSPTINGDAVPPAWILLSHVDAVNNRKKPALVFGSYGWSGEAVPNLTARLQGLKMSVFGEGYKVCFVPSEEDLRKAEELGRAFAESLK